MSDTEAEFEDVAPDDQAEGVDDDRPGWLPENFQTPEALVGSYRELERAFHERSERLAEVEAQLAELSELQAESYAEAEWAEGVDDPSEAMRQAMSQRDVQAAVSVAMAQQQQATALTQAGELLAATVPDWPQYAPLVAQKIAQQPYLLPAAARTSADAAAAQLASIYEGIKNAQAAAARQGQEITQAKLAAQSMSGAGQRQPNPTSDEEWARQISEANLGLFKLDI